MVLLAFKKAVICPLLVRLSLDLTMLDNLCSVSNLSTLEVIVEKVVGTQFQSLDEVDYMDPFHSRFRPDYRTDKALDDFVGDM